MDVSRLSTKTAFTAVAIWLGIFLVFTCTAVTLAVTSHPFYSLLIITGIFSATVFAVLYVRHSNLPCDPLSVQEIHVLPMTSSAFSTVDLRSTTVSEPCLCTERPVSMWRSSSVPSLHDGIKISSFLPPATSVDFVPAKDARRHDQGHQSREDSKKLEAVQGSNEDQTQDKHNENIKMVAYDGQQPVELEVSVGSSESNLASPPAEIPAFWKRSSGGTTPLLSSSDSSTKGDSERPYEVFNEDDDDIEAKAMLLEDSLSCESLADDFRASSVVVVPLTQAVEELWKSARGRSTPPKEVGCDVVDIPNAALQVTPSALAESCQAVAQTGDDTESIETWKEMKKSKRKIRFIPRFLRGKKKEFVRFK